MNWAIRPLFCRTERYFPWIDAFGWWYAATMTSERTSLSVITADHQMATRRAIKQIAALGLAIVLVAVIAGLLIS